MATTTDDPKTRLAKILLRAVCVAAPDIINANSLPGPHCVLATRIGVEVLRRFGVEAEPYPVEVAIFNDAWKVWGLETDFHGGEPERVRRGAHLLTNAPSMQGGPSLPSGNPVTRAPWDGHLVIRSGDWLLDLDLGSSARPTKGIHVPPALVAPISPDGVVCGTVRQADGPETHLVYRPLVAPYRDEYLTAKDWTRDHSALVTLIEARVRGLLSVWATQPGA